MGWEGQWGGAVELRPHLLCHLWFSLDTHTCQQWREGVVCVWDIVPAVEGGDGVCGGGGCHAFIRSQWQLKCPKIGIKISKTPLS